jgi:hypothetical protein
MNYTGNEAWKGVPYRLLWLGLLSCELLSTLAAVIYQLYSILIIQSRMAAWRAGPMLWQPINPMLNVLVVYDVLGFSVIA